MKPIKKENVSAGMKLTYKDDREQLDFLVIRVDLMAGEIDIEANGEESFLMNSDFENGYIFQPEPEKPKSRKDENIDFFMAHISGLKTDYHGYIFIHGIDPKTGYFRLVVFGQRGYKPQVNFNFKTFAARTEYVAQYQNRIDKDLEAEKEREEKAKEKNDQYQPGAILYASWGYEQTNIDFYLIVARSGNTVTLQEIGQDKIYDQRTDSGKCTPNQEIKKGDPFKKRLSPYGGTKLNSYKYASLYDGRPLSWSSWH